MKESPRTVGRAALREARPAAGAATFTARQAGSLFRGKEERRQVLFSVAELASWEAFQPVIFLPLPILALQ